MKHFFERVIGMLILYSIVMFFIEAELRGIEGHSTGIFLWSEWVVAVVFTVEFFCRWIYDRRYPFTLSAWIDLCGFLPFWIGFFVPYEHLKWIRTLRVLRLLKVLRYNNALRHFARAMHKVRDELSLLGYASLMILVFGSIIIYEIERDIPDTKFQKLSDAVWWAVVTLTTIGYGDTYPITQGGRVVAVIVMILGVGIFGTFISTMGSGMVAVYREERIIREQKIRHQRTDWTRTDPPDEDHPDLPPELVNC
jgi:voltage-gated potassium channel